MLYTPKRHAESQKHNLNITQCLEMEYRAVVRFMVFVFCCCCCVACSGCCRSGCCFRCCCCCCLGDTTSFVSRPLQTDGEFFEGVRALLVDKVGVLFMKVDTTATTFTNHTVFLGPDPTVATHYLGCRTRWEVFFCMYWTSSFSREQTVFSTTGSIAASNLSTWQWKDRNGYPSAVKLVETIQIRTLQKLMQPRKFDLINSDSWR